MTREEILEAYQQQVKKTRQAVMLARRKLARIASPGFKSRLINKVQAKINAEGWPQRIVQQRFEVESSRSINGEPWAALSAATIRYRLTKGYGAGPILFNTGRLKAAAISAASGTFRIGRPGTRFSIGRVGVGYAKYHETGTGRMPRRSFFSNPSEEESELMNARAAKLLGQEVKREMNS